MKTKNALIVGIRDEDSICFSVANELKRAGYDLYATYQDETTRTGVRRVADGLGIEKIFPYDARSDEDLEQLAMSVKEENLTFDILVHGISYSTAEGAKLDMPLVDVSWEEFTDAIRVGAFSLVELSGKLLACLNEGASILSLSSRWSQVAVPNFNVVCAAKAGLESIVRGLAQSLGKSKHIRVNGISPGFVSTYTLSRLGNRLEMLEADKQRSPLKYTVQKEDIATLAVSVLENTSITGMIFPIDAGVGIVD